MKSTRILLLYAQSSANNTLSYQVGWPEHFLRDPRFECIPINLADHRLVVQARGFFLTRFKNFEAVVLLHSVFSNRSFLTKWLFEAIQQTKQPKLYFIGNEYKLMPEKMDFSEALGVSVLISQCNAADVHALYHDRLGCQVAYVPNTGLNPEMFSPKVPFEERPIDIGYRAFDAPFYLGHNERRRIADYFLEQGPAYNLSLDISMDSAKRLDSPAWADFLNQCKGQIGTEAGGDFFELTDASRWAVIKHLETHPNAMMDDVFERFFKDYKKPVPLRILSGRNIEAAATKTVQILFEGRYNDHFQPDEHYIALKKDYSNIDEVMTKFRDQNYCLQITENAYNMAIQEFTYERLLERFDQILQPLL